jgi:hypothetical protein
MATSRKPLTFVTSAMIGICMRPSPPRLRGVLIQARCTSGVSVDAAINWQFRASNSLARSLKAMISVGQTKVKSYRGGGRGIEEYAKQFFLWLYGGIGAWVGGWVGHCVGEPPSPGGGHRQRKT